MADLTIVIPSRGVTLFAEEAAEAGGDKFLNTGKELLVIEHTNGAGSDVTLTITTEQTVDGEDVGDKDILITKGTRQILGPWPMGIYNDVNEKVGLTYDDNTDIMLAVVKHL